jgi:starch phosphorylase
LIRELFEKSFGPNWFDVTRDSARWKDGVERISDENLWAAHSLLKQRLVAFVRHRAFHSRLARAENQDYIESAKHIFDPDALTIGFARRIAAYKRWGLLMSDTERLRHLLSDESRPVQVVFAGKAHPQDQGAKLILQQLSQWKYDPLVSRRAVFVQDYDQEIARQLVQSVDVWLNVPRRPFEASGTSGEKVAMNGGLNLSILDGWWPEGCDGKNGWAVGEACGGGEGPEVDRCDAESLYKILEEEVVPCYYDRDEHDLPRRWVQMMKHSLITLVPAFNSNRMVEEYAERIYCEELTASG